MTALERETVIVAGPEQPRMKSILKCLSYTIVYFVKTLVQYASVKVKTIVKMFD